MTSAERIRILRERAGLSQNDLAVKLDLSRSSISMYETGERIPSTYVYQSMADLFNVDLDYIMGRSDKITVLPERLDYENRISKNTNRVLASMRRLNDDGQMSTKKSRPRERLTSSLGLFDERSERSC